MSKVSTLYDLQQVDLEIGAKDKDLALALEQLGDDSVLHEQRAIVQELRERVEVLEKQRQSLDTESSDLQAKIFPLEQKLYSGQVKIPKELMALQQDVEMLKGRRGQLDDAELQIMMQLDESNQLLGDESLKLAAMERDWNEEQQRLAGVRDSLSADLEVLRRQRGGIASQVDAASLTMYERVREGRQGVAVVSVSRGTCTGCRINVPAIEIQRARPGRDLVFCQSCGRILHVS